MQNKEIIIFLIRQDMIHNRLVLGMEHLGLQVADEHNLEIMEKIANFMEVEQEKTKEDWCNMYLAFRSMIYTSLEVEDWKEKLNELSEKCYNQLMAISMGVPA